MCESHPRDVSPDTCRPLISVRLYLSQKSVRHPLFYWREQPLYISRTTVFLSGGSHGYHRTPFLINARASLLFSPQSPDPFPPRSRRFQAVSRNGGQHCGRCTPPLRGQRLFHTPGRELPACRHAYIHNFCLVQTDLKGFYRRGGPVSWRRLAVGVRRGGTCPGRLGGGLFLQRRRCIFLFFSNFLFFSIKW